jgi:hypothetical protein
VRIGGTSENVFAFREFGRVDSKKNSRAETLCGHESYFALMSEQFDYSPSLKI